MSFDIFGLGSAVGGLVQSGINWGINKKNYELSREAFNWQKEQAEKQNKFAREQFDYQKELNNLTMERQDSQYQRAYADLQKAGINPLTAVGTGGAASGGTTAGSFSGGGNSATAPQMAQLSGINDIASGVMNILTQRQNISQSRTQEKLIEEQTKTEREKQGYTNAQTKNIRRETQYYDDLSAKADAEITAINKENELRELRKETEKAKAFDTWQSGYNKEHDRRIGQASQTKTGERTYYGVLDGSGVIQGGGMLGNTIDQLYRNFLNMFKK